MKSYRPRYDLGWISYRGKLRGAGADLFGCSGCGTCADQGILFCGTSAPRPTIWSSLHRGAAARCGSRSGGAGSGRRPCDGPVSNRSGSTTCATPRLRSDRGRREPVRDRVEGRSHVGGSGPRPVRASAAGLGGAGQRRARCARAGRESAQRARWTARWKLSTPPVQWRCRDSDLHISVGDTGLEPVTSAV